MNQFAPASTPMLVELAVIVALTMVYFIGRRRRRRRLEALAAILDRAAEGDFSERFDDTDDARDDIALVGRAFNRVRTQLAYMVLTDPLTACVNRRGFDQGLGREIARADRAGSDLALLALDIDHFKEVNDRFGHLVGDAVLREVGALLLHVARAGDVVARTGGEEFSLILPDTSSAGANQLATRLCEALANHRFKGGADGTALTVSIGIASTDAMANRRSSEIANALKGRADEALYIAKRAGRNRVRAWTPQDEQIVLATLLP